MRIGVSIREAGWLLGKSEPQVRRLLAAGRLEYAVRSARVTAASVRGLFPADDFSQLREHALDLVLQGRISPPASPTRYAKPAPLTELAELTRPKTMFDAGGWSVRSRDG